MADHHPAEEPANRSPPPTLIEGADYYIEAGRWVFTARFLRNRGYCCRNGCRHCPYGYERDPECGPEPSR